MRQRKRRWLCETLIVYKTWSDSRFQTAPSNEHFMRQPATSLSMVAAQMVGSDKARSQRRGYDDPGSQRRTATIGILGTEQSACLIDCSP